MNLGGQIKFPYGKKEISVKIPGQYFYEIGYTENTRYSVNQKKEIERALSNPIGCSRLSVMAQGVENAIVIIDDITRPTPVYQIIPCVFDQLTQGKLTLNKIKILVATGTHRPMTKKEIQKKVGRDISKRVEVINHDYRNVRDLLNLGVTPSGIPIIINRQVVEADLIVGIGNIMPHRYCGWSGGAKIIQPGVCGEATTVGTHLLMAKDRKINLGIVENQVRCEMEAVANSVNLGFIINTVLNKRGEIVKVVAGDFRKAFRKGVELARKIYEVPLSSKAEIVLTSSYPFNLNFWQGGKALYAADLVVKDNGTIIFVSPCFEGWGEHPELIRLLGKDSKTIKTMISKNEITDGIAAAASLAIAKITDRANIYLVSDNIDLQQDQGSKLQCFSSLQFALDNALGLYDSKVKVTLLPEGGIALPIIRSETI